MKGPIEYFLNGEKFTLDNGDAIFLPSGAMRARNESVRGVDYISFNYTCEQNFALPKVLRGAAAGEVSLLIAAYDKINTSEHIDNKEKNENLLACILGVLEDREKAESLNPLTRKIMGYIHANLKKKITLDNIGELTYFSPVYCDTVFKRETGKSIIEYLLDKRIEEAKNLLLEGALTLSQISESVGFGDYNYFFRMFKKRTGYTPSAYKRLCGK